MEYSQGYDMFGKRVNKMGQKAGGSRADQMTMLRSPLDGSDDVQEDYDGQF